MTENPHDGPRSTEPPTEPATSAATARADPGDPPTAGRSFDDGSPRVDGGTAWVTLTGFQRDLVKCIRHLAEESTVPTGRVIKERVEELYGEDVNHGRLYQNLNRLVEEGWIDKRVVDGRTNAYYLTDQATAALDEAAIRFAAVCDLSISPTES